MKKLILGLTLLGSLSSFATIADEATLQSIAAYNKANPEMAEKYKIATSSMYIIAAETECSGGELVNWRTKQYDLVFKKCLNQVYRDAFTKGGYQVDVQSNNLHTENILLEKSLKINVLNDLDIELNADNSVNLENKNLTVKKLTEAMNKLELLISSEY